MRNIDIKSLMSAIIEGMSNKVNKKALNECINEFEGYSIYNYNELLKMYYDRIHRQKNNKIFYEFISINDFEDENDFKKYIKENYNVKWYKTNYDYKKRPYPIKQKNTGFIIGINNGFVSYGHYAFDVNQFIEENDIKIVGIGWVDKNY